MLRALTAGCAAGLACGMALQPAAAGAAASESISGATPYSATEISKDIADPVSTTWSVRH